MFMLSNLRHWYGRSLQRKLLLPLFGLMLTSAIASALVFVVGTARTRDRLLAEQSASDAQQISQTLIQRSDTVQVAGTLLANDPALHQALAPRVGADLTAINSRALALRERFRLDFVQIYDAQRQQRANVVGSMLYRQSALLQVQPTLTPHLMVVNEHGLLVFQQPLPDGIGVVVVGIDLGEELHRIVAEQRLPIEVQAEIAPFILNTNQQAFQAQAIYRSDFTLLFGGKSVQFTLVRPTNTIEAVTNAGLNVMLISSAATTLLLLLIGWYLARSVVRPITALAHTAHRIADGELHSRAVITTHDEIATLGQAFNTAAERLTRVLRAQRRETQRERAILASIADGVIVSDAQGRIVVLNQAAHTIIAAAEAERLRLAAENGESDHRFYAALEAAQPAINAAIGRSSTQPPSRIVLAGRTFRLTANPIWLDDELLGAVANLHDITAEVESERIKSEFIAIAAHELRTPLTSIRGFTDLFLWSDQSNLTPNQSIFLTTIDRNVKRLNDLINDLLDISRLDQQRTNISPSPVALGVLLRDTSELFAAQVQAKSQQLMLHIPATLPTLSLDQAHIRRVLQNLISNAIKYTPQRGTIELSIVQRRDDLVVSVRDTGVGIALKDQSRIFGRFFRADNPLSEQEGGTGLGLAISKSLVELNHGSIYFESTEGVGTTFYVAFPLALIYESFQYHSSEEMEYAA